MSQSTNLSISIHFDSEEKTDEATEKIVLLTLKEGRQPNIESHGETEIIIEDWFNGQASAEHFGNEYLNICKAIGGITYVSADLTQSIDSIYFDGDDEIGEFG